MICMFRVLTPKAIPIFLVVDQHLVSTVLVLLIYIEDQIGSVRPFPLFPILTMIPKGKTIWHPINSQSDCKCSSQVETSKSSP